MNYEFREGQLYEVSDGPLEYEWVSLPAALQLAGYAEFFQFKPAERLASVSVYQASARTDAERFGFQFLCRFSPDGLSSWFVYCKGMREVLDFTRYVDPILRLSWQGDEIFKRLESASKQSQASTDRARLSKEERAEQKTLDEQTDRREMDLTNLRWRTYLASKGKT